MTRDEIKEQIDELMRQYAEGEIDGETYKKKMMEFLASVQSSDDGEKE